MFELCEDDSQLQPTKKRMKLFVGYNRQNLVKLATKITTDENFNRRNYPPTKIITDKASKRGWGMIEMWLRQGRELGNQTKTKSGIYIVF